MRILLDIDGVAADFATRYLETLQLLYSELRDKTVDDLTCWDHEEALGLDVEARVRMVDRIAQPGWCFDLEPYPGAAAAVARLSASHDVYIVTSPFNSPTWAHERAQWCKRHLGIPRDRVVSTSAKYVVSGDVLVDDKTSTLVEWVSHHHGGHAVQFRRPWNQHDGWRGMSVESWDELEALIRRIPA